MPKVAVTISDDVAPSLASASTDRGGVTAPGPRPASLSLCDLHLIARSSETPLAASLFARRRSQTGGIVVAQCKRYLPRHRSTNNVPEAIGEENESLDSRKTKRSEPAAESSEQSTQPPKLERAHPTGRETPKQRHSTQRTIGDTQDSFRANVRRYRNSQATTPRDDSRGSGRSPRRSVGSSIRDALNNTACTIL